MQYLWAFFGWVVGSFLPSLEAAYLAYQAGKRNQQLAEAHAAVDQAQHRAAQVQTAQQIRQRLDADGVAGAERMRQWYAALKRAS